MDQQPSNSINQGGTIRTKGLDEKFCGSCVEIIKIMAEICPKCSVRQRGHLDKTTLLLLTFFMGGIGGHKFYTGKNWQGVFYLLFCWTGIPGLIALVEFIIYACTSSERLQEKYSGGGSGVVIAVIAGGIAFIFMVGIVSAIAIPQFVTYRNRAYQAAIIAELQKVSVAENAFFVEHARYSNELRELNFAQGTPDVSVKIVSADGKCFTVAGKHSRSTEMMSIDCNGLK